MNDRIAEYSRDPHKDTELEWAWGTIVSPEPEEFAFVCRVLLDDGREVQGLIGRHKFGAERLPIAGDRVCLIVETGLCLVTEWKPAS